MKPKHCARALPAWILIVALSLTQALFSQKARLAPLNKIMVNGEVTIIRGSDGNWVISPWFSVTRNGNPVSHLNVSLEGFRLRETMPGQYAGIRITAITPVAGNTLQFTISSRPALSATLVAIEKIAISGKAVIKSLAQITLPASGSSLSLAALGTTIDVAWSGGAPPFALGLLKASGGAAVEIFSQKGLPGHSFSLPATLFLPGSTYSVIISYDMKPFALKTSSLDAALVIDSSSAVSLRCSVISSFTVN